MNQFFQTILLALAILPVSVSIVHAQATRTWVSGVGDDANPCSRTAPCKTFAGAISKTATSGVISVLDPGGYGSVIITKSITLDGGGIEGSILASLANGIVVNAAGAKVILRNLTIFGAGNGLSGVRVVNAAHVAVENCTIGGMTNGIETISGATGSLHVYNSIIQGNTTNGILIGDGNAIIEGTRFDSNGLDAVRVNGAGSFVSIRRGVAAGNGNVGFTANAGYLSVSDSLLSNNYIGIAAGGGVVTVSNTMIASSSLRALYTAGSGQLLTFGNNQLSANAENGNFTGAVPLQ